MPPRPACRLFVIPARDVPCAVVLRRGPTAWYHVLLWDLVTDRIEPGAWIKGRIYEDKCDLSPDGRLLVTFVHQGARSTTPYSQAWTAVSRPPWLHALTLWPQGTTYGGGGRFTSNGELVLRNSAPRTHPDHPLGPLEVTSGSPPSRAGEEQIEGADWAGRGQDGKLVFARDGRLYRRVRAADREVADLREIEPSPDEAPAWAFAWPSAAKRRAAKRTGVRRG